MSESKRILILTYYWPPSGGGGVQRWMYFAKYLKEAGHEPVVITVSPEKASYPLKDETQLEQVKSIETIYTSTFEPLKLYSFLKSGSKDKAIPYGNLGEEKGSFLAGMMAFIRLNFFIPDARKGWNRFAKKAGIKLLSGRKFDWIVSTGPPHSSHLAAMFLAERFKVNWLADFRDPWTEIYYLKKGKRLAFAQRKDQALENEVLKNADLLTTVGPGMMDLLRAKLKDPSKLKLLYNGYDHELLKEIPEPKTRNSKFLISHMGLLGSSQRIDVLIDALKNTKLNHEEIELILAGTVDEVHLKKISAEIPDIQFLHKGFIPRKEALALMKKSDLLMLCPPMIGETGLIVSTKTMEYLAVERPVLGIGDEHSDAATLVKKQHFSAFYGPEKLKEIEEFLLNTYKNWKNNEELVSNFDVSAFSRQAIANELIELIN